MNTKEIGKFIKKLREEKGWTQEELAEKIPISRGAVSKWECGKTLADIEILQKLSILFKVTIEELLSGERNPKGNILLKLFKENNKHMRKFKISLIIITILVFIFLGYYFINQFRSIKIYTINATGKMFHVSNGLYINTKEKIYFNLGKINSKEDVEILKIELYLNQVQDDNFIFMTNDNSILFYDYNGYESYLKEKDINDLYLKIYYDDTFEIIKLNLVKDYENRNLLFLKKSKLKSGNQETINNSNSSNKLALKLEKFTKKEDYYYFKNKYNSQDVEIYFIPNADLISLQFFDENQNIVEEYIYHILSKALNYYDYNSNIEYSLPNNECYSPSCPTYEILKEKENLFFNILNNI